ncbi:MAG: SDR family NAD(P)-dependent oxidoreductase [Acidobacteriota bacterium]|nr:SDR family NAD(P)-dependent oxidoreductase [Acidobacteriota bacterium]
MVDKVAVVIGIGPGLGAAVVRRFAREGYAVAGLARNPASSEDLKAELAAESVQLELIPADAADAGSLAEAMDRVRATLGKPEVAVYNAGAFKMSSVLEVTPDEFENAWKVNCHGAFLLARQVLPDMIEAGRGTLLLTSATAAWRGSARFSCLAVGKFGLRALSQSLAREYGPSGVHVASVVVDGLIDTPRVRGMFGEDGPKLKPDAIAETYWQLHRQDPSAWTLELDLRPAAEKF